MTDSDILTHLTGKVCLCGEYKRDGRSFCIGHSKKLPQYLRDMLYKKDGYAETFRAAARHLGLSTLN